MTSLDLAPLLVFFGLAVLRIGVPLLIVIALGALVRRLEHALL